MPGMQFKIKIENKEYKIEISEIDEKIKIKVGEKDFIFEPEIKEEKKIPTAQALLPKRDFSKKELKAPLSGIVTEIFVQKGDFIKRGQKAFLISAMKMENEIISDFDGKIKEVFVKKNQKVESGETLLILE